MRGMILSAVALVIVAAGVVSQKGEGIGALVTVRDEVTIGCPNRMLLSALANSSNSLKTKDVAEALGLGCQLLDRGAAAVVTGDDGGGIVRVRMVPDMRGLWVPMASIYDEDVELRRRLKAHGLSD